MNRTSAFVVFTTALVLGSAFQVPYDPSILGNATGGTKNFSFSYPCVAPKMNQTELRLTVREQTVWVTKFSSTSRGKRYDGTFLHFRRNSTAVAITSSWQVVRSDTDGDHGLDVVTPSINKYLAKLSTDVRKIGRCTFADVRREGAERKQIKSVLAFLMFVGYQNGAKWGRCGN